MISETPLPLRNVTSSAQKGNKPLRLITLNAPKPNLPLFIFLPGMDGTGELLRPQLDSLETTFDIRCLSIPLDDLRGWQGLVNQTAYLINREKQQAPSRPIVLCGESFGGCLALQLAAGFPHLFERLVLINPASSASNQPWMSWGAAITQWLPNPLYRLSSLGLLPFLCVLPRISPENQQALLREMQSVTSLSAAWRISLLSQFDVTQLPLEQIQQPVLMLASGSDYLLPSVKEAKRLCRSLPNSYLLILPDSGHACLLEKEVNLGNILRSQN